MRRLGIRVTAQRVAVAEVLQESHDHPTVQNVYERVRQTFPQVTIATVYNIMNTFADKGLVQPLPFSDVTRYDTNPAPHANLVCIRCGQIIDVPDSDGAVSQLKERLTSGKGFRVIWQRVDFYGLCDECATVAEQADIAGY